MSDLTKHREAMIQACTLAVDAMIAQADSYEDFKEKPAAFFEAELVCRFVGTAHDVRCRPALNLQKDTADQLTRRAAVIEEPAPAPAS